VARDGSRYGDTSQMRYLMISDYGKIFLPASAITYCESFVGHVAYRRLATRLLLTQPRNKLWIAKKSLRLRFCSLIGCTFMCLGATNVTVLKI